MIDLNEEIYALKMAFAVAQADGTDTEDLSNKLSGRRAMVIGEGAVFLVLLIIGAFTTRRAFTREVELSNQQKNFLMSVSHEFKSPLSAIKLNIQTLLKHDLDQVKSEELLSASMKDADRLVVLVDNIIIATDIESGDYPLRIDKLNLSSLVAENVSVIAGRGASNIKMEIIPDLYVRGDEQAMISIVSNLLENAIKYSHKDANINVSVIALDGHVHVTISDEGIGINTEDQEKIFEKFFRAGDEATRSTKGTGLGLFIARHLTEKQQGSISVHRNKPKGSRFVVQFAEVT